MKALIAEIHKDHCIAVTRDGRFVRQDIPAGAYEVGDEIVIEAAELYAVKARPAGKSFGLFARLAAGFAAVVILGGGSYLGIKYAVPGFAFGPVKAVSQEAQAEQTKQAKTADLSGQENTDGDHQTLKQDDEQTLAAEAPASESGVAGSQSIESSSGTSKSGQSSSASNQGSGEPEDTQESQDSGQAAATVTNDGEGIAPASLPVLFEGTFKLEKNNIDVLINNYPDLLVTYKFEQLFTQDSGSKKSAAFTIKIKNLQKSTFSGNVDIIFMDKDSGELQTSAIETGNKSFNEVYEQQIPVDNDAESFKMTLYGSFDDI